MLQEEKEFVEQAYLLSIDENLRDGGLLFPFLSSKKWNPNRIIRAIVIPSRKNTTACFACLGYKRTYNGIFFSCSPELEEEEKELVEVVYYRIRADIKLVRTGDDVVLSIKPNAEELEKFFESMDAAYISKKYQLEEQVEISF